jgi:hypothetical protein
VLDVAREYRAEPVPPQADRFVADDAATLGKQVFYVPEKAHTSSTTTSRITLGRRSKVADKISGLLITSGERGRAPQLPQKFRRTH